MDHAKQFDIIGIGDCSMDFVIALEGFPQSDQKALGKLVGRYGGGMVSNFLAAASRFGAACGSVLCIGDDTLGQESLSAIREFGVDTQQCVIRKDTDTFFSVTCIDSDGEKKMILAITDAMSPRASEVNSDYLQKAAFVQMIGTDIELVLPIARRAKELGVLVSLDFEPGTRNMDSAIVDEVLSLTHIMFPNKAGLFDLVGHDDVARGAQELLHRGPKVVVVTLGSAGSEVFTTSEHFHAPSFPVQVRDTTGAGDTFNGVFLTAYAKGYPLKDCAYLATAVAAQQITEIGARSKLLTEQQARAFLATQGVALESGIEGSGANA